MPRHSLPNPLLAMVVAVMIGSTAIADSPAKHSTESLARLALEADKGESANALAELRSMGPEGLRVFLEANKAEIEAALKTRADAAKSNARDGDTRGHTRAAQTDQVLTALDSICQQKDCFASRLYWYTDFEQAKSAARAQGKPILSLRLLGRLNEDLSCANSRLFRIVLYANEQVSKLLRERFVLHWQSVRPVPTVTIDFGDGRKMERTLTGNSIHYVLDSEGRVIDALPGLYGPGAFLRELERISSAAAKLNGSKTDEERQTALFQYHQSRFNELENAWLNDVKRAGLRVAPSREIPKPVGAGSTPSAQTRAAGSTPPDALSAGAGSNPPSAQTTAAGSNPPSATMAAAAAISKTVMVERPILRGMSDNPKSLDSIGSDAGWSMIAALHAEDATLDQATRALMSFKDPSMSGASLRAAITALERAVAEDTVRNEYLFRARIHAWLPRGSVSWDVARLNEKIYAELFLTPSLDAWLGLRPAGAYSGIDEDGVRR